MAPTTPPTTASPAMALTTTGAATTAPATLPAVLRSLPVTVIDPGPVVTSPAGGLGIGWIVLTGGVPPVALPEPEATGLLATVCGGFPPAASTGLPTGADILPTEAVIFSLPSPSRSRSRPHFSCLWSCSL